MLSVFFTLCFWGLVLRLLSSFCCSSLLRVVVRKIFGSELLFLGVGVCCVCFGAVLPMFLLLFWFFRSRNCLKKFSCCQVWCFWVVVFLPLVVSPTSSFFSLFFFFERDSSGSHRAHPHTHLVFLFLFLVFVPRRVCLFTRFGRASFPSGVFSGCHSGPRAFFGFSWDFSEACFLDARRQGCSLLLVLVLFFPFSFCFAAFFTRTRRGGPVIVRGVPPGHRACVMGFSGPKCFLHPKFCKC